MLTVNKAKYKAVVNIIVKIVTKSLKFIKWHIQSPINDLKWSFCGKSQHQKTINYFRKTLHLRCLTGFWIPLWMRKSVFHLFLISQNRAPWRKRRCTVTTHQSFSSSSSLLPKLVFFVCFISVDKAGIVPHLWWMIRDNQTLKTF